MPVDLNSLLYQLESTLAHAYHVTGAEQQAASLHKHAALRKSAIRRYLWNRQKGVFADYAWREQRPTGAVTAATLYPLFFGIAEQRQALLVAGAVRSMLLEPDGLATTTATTGQQWDFPNGWAPLQWIAIKGLADYGRTDLAQAIAQRWIRKNIAVYRATGKLLEKYDVTVERGRVAANTRCKMGLVGRTECCENS